MAADGSVIIEIDGDDSKFRSALNGLGGVASKAVAGVTTAIAGIGAALTGAAGYAVKVGSEFEASMSNVAAISGATGDELQSLTDKAKEMGAKTKFSATESADALSYMAMAGWKTDDMLGGLEGIMSLAAASGEDLAATSDIVTDALTAFGMQAGDSGRFADVLAAASSNANTNVGLMGETFKYVAPVAGALGYTVEDTATAIGLMANAGIKGSQAGTSLRSMLTNLAKPSEQVAKYMDKLGLSLTDAQGQVKPMRDLLGDMRAKFDGLTEAQKAEYAAGIAGQEGMSGLLAIVNASDEDFAKLTSAIDESNGAAAEMAETMTDNLQGAVTIAKSGIEGLGISIYEGMQEPLKEAVKTATGMIQQLQEAYNQGGIEGLVGELGNVFADVATQIAEAAPQIIDAAVSLISSFLSGIQDNAPQLAESARGIIQSLVGGIITLLPEIITTGISLLASLAQGIADALPELVPQAADAVITLVDGLIDNIPLLVDAGADIITTLAQGLTQTLPELVPKALDAILTLVDGLLDNIDQLIDAAIGMVEALAEGLVEALPVLIAKAPEIIAKLVDAIVRNVPKLLSAAVDIIIGLKDGIKDNLPKIAEAGGQILMSLVNGIISLIGRIQETVGEIIGKIRTKFADTDWLQVGIDVISGIANGIKDGVMQIGNVIKDAAGNMLSGFKAALGIHSPSRVMRDQVGKMISMGISMGIKDKSKDVTGAITTVSNAAIKAARASSSSYKDVGASYIDNLTYAVNAGVDASVAAIEQWVEADTEAYNRKVDAETETMVSAKERQMAKVGKSRKEAIQKEIDAIKESAKAQKKAYEDAGKEVTDAYKAALSDGYDEALQITKDRVTEITDEFNTAHNEIVKQQESMQGKLSGFGSLFEIDDDSGDLILSNLDEHIEAIRAYDKALSQLQMHTLPEGFLEQVTSLGVEEATKFAQTLIELPSEEFGGYMAAWQKQQDLARGVAEQFYKDQLDALDKSFAAKLDEALASIPGTMTGIGQDSIQGMIDGMYSKSGALSDAAAKIVRRAVNAMREEADIHSPSGVTRDLVGKPLAQGVGVGFDQALPDVLQQMRRVVDNETSRLSYDAAARSNVQTAQAAPQPQQSTYYREYVETTPTINVKGDMAALVRYMYPHIEMERKRRGDKLIKGGTMV